MNSVVSRKVKSWVEQYINHVSVYNPPAVHIDELLEHPVALPDMLDLALEAFVCLIEEMESLDVPAQPAMRIALPSAREIKQLPAPRNRDEVEREMGHMVILEPPSLYLMDWEALLHYAVIERYEVPLAFNLLPEPIEGIYSYYSEMKTKYSFGDIVRSICLEY